MIKLRKTERFETFINIVKECKNDVFIKTQHGDVYNLKSDFSRYVSLPAILGYRGDELILECKDLEDEKLIQDKLSKLI